MKYKSTSCKNEDTSFWSPVNSFRRLILVSLAAILSSSWGCYNFSTCLPPVVLLSLPILFHHHSTDMFHFFIPSLLDAYLLYVLLHVLSLFSSLTQDGAAMHSIFSLLLDTCYAYIYSFLLVYKLLRGTL